MTCFPAETNRLVGAEASSRLLPLFIGVGGLAAVSAAFRLASNVLHVVFWGAITAALVGLPSKTETKGVPTATTAQTIGGYEVPGWLTNGGASIIDRLKKITK